MKSSSLCACVVVSLLTLTLLAYPTIASAREMVLPAGTILKCTLDEPNFSTATVAIGDPVLCRLHSLTEFGRQAIPRGSYLVGHLEAAEDPGHFWGKGYMKIQFDRIGLPDGDMPLDAKVIGTRGYKVDKNGAIDGKGHPKRDIVEWMIPPLWPWKIIMLPARGPRPTLKGESQLTLRLMDDVQLPQVAQTFGPDWHFFGHPYNDPSYNPTSYNTDAYNSSYGARDNAGPQLAVRRVRPAQGEPRLQEVQVRYASYKVPAPKKVDYAEANLSAASTDSNVISADAQLTSLASGSPVFVLKSGTLLSVGGYGYRDGRVSYELTGGGSGVIGVDEIDWATTMRLNNQRGLRVSLPSGQMIVGTSGE